MLCLQNTKTYCQSHKLPVCPNQERSFVVQGEGKPFTCMGSPLEAEWGFLTIMIILKSKRSLK